MASQLNNKIIRDSSPPELARYLRTQHKISDWRTISDHLISSVESGSIPPDAFQIWLSVCKDVNATVALLRQEVSILGRHVAIRRFAKYMRTDAGLQAAWEAVGDVRGLAELMASFSVDHVRLLCNSIAYSGTATGAVNQRQNVISKLYESLSGAGSVPNPDTRPLQPHYRLLLPACAAETALTHTTTGEPGRRVLHVHAAAFEKKIFRELFPDIGEAKKVSEYLNILDKSRQFALAVLKQIASDTRALKRNGDSIMSALILPLLSRAHSSHSHHTTYQVLHLAMQCANQEPKVAEAIDLDRKGLLFYAVQHWKRSHDREKAEHLLCALISATPRKRDIISDIPILARTIEPRLRYPLLRMFLLHAKGYGTDISSEAEDDDEKIANLGKSWSVDTFVYLHAPSALRLFKRLAKIHADGKFISIKSDLWPKNSVVTSLMVGSRHADPDIVEAFIQSRVAVYVDEHTEHLARFKQEVAQRKHRAGDSREWKERAEWAVSALKLAIATQSLDLAAETFMWARRFIRDPQTNKHLYLSNNILSEESLDLLSGLPDPKFKRQLPQVEKLKSSIDTSNKIIFSILETAAMCIREPSYSVGDWDAVKRLPSMVLQRRLERAQSIYDILNDATIDIIWEPTIDICIRMEQFGLNSENEALELFPVSGPLDQWAGAPPTEPTCKFLDKLAEKRDALWFKFRRTAHPATSTLHKPWPKGLPVQHLIPKLDLKAYGLPRMPYVQSRCEDVVFSSTTVLLPTPKDKETRDAIGLFVDHYTDALGIYLMTAEHQQSRDQRLRKAWTHATTTLTGNRMNASEAVQFWKAKVFCTITIEPSMAEELERLCLAPKHKEIDLPELPGSVHEGTPVPWIPWSDEETSRELMNSCLDCMILPNNYTMYGTPLSRLKTTSLKDKTSTTVRKPLLFRNLRCIPIRNLPGPTQDALIAAFIAYINTKLGSNSALFLKSFPHNGDIRFPAFYIAQESLKDSGPASFKEKSGYIGDLSLRVPVPLLVRLAISLMARLDESDKEDPNDLEVAMSIIKQIVRSDRPEAARGLVKQVVLGRQEDSSWHRHLFNVGYLRRLSAAHARQFYEELCSEIQQKQADHAAKQARLQFEKELAVREDEAAQVTESKATSPKEQTAETQLGKSFVKISTTKMVAQVLRKADFVDEAFSSEVLFCLLNTTSHPDVQFSIVDALISILEETRDPKLWSLLFDNLEKHVIPIVSSVNERRPPKEEEWVAAEAGTGPLPEVIETDASKSLPPLLQLLVSAANKWEKGTAELRDWATRILLPIAKKSAADNERWLNIFMQHHKFELPEQCLPNVPVWPTLLLTYWSEIPQAMTKGNLDTLKQYSLVNLYPHDSLKTSTDIVKRTRDLVTSNEGKHWLRLWDNPGSEAFGCGINQIVASLYTLDEGSDCEVKVSDIHAFIRHLMLDLISRSDIANFERLMHAFGNGVSGSSGIASINRTPEAYEALEKKGVSKRRDRCVANCVPLLEKAVAEIDALRTAAWQYNPQRSPAELPQTFAIKKKIMFRKHWRFERAHELSKEAVTSFVADLSGLIDQMIAHDAPYHTEWPQLVSAIRQRLLRSSTQLSVAVSLMDGVRTQSPELVDHLKVELAYQLFLTTTGSQGEEAVIGARAVLKDCITSPNEAIREEGKAAVKALLDEGQTKDGWFGKDNL